MNPFGSVTDSIPGVGGDKNEDDGMSKEEAEEQERLRQDAIRQAERERREKYKKQEEERENVRQTIRDKVRNVRVFFGRFDYTTIGVTPYLSSDGSSTRKLCLVLGFWNCCCGEMGSILKQV